MKTVKYIVQIVLAGLIIVLFYLIYSGVMKPINFEKEKDSRDAKVIERLKDIRTAQVAYKSVYQKYTGSFDTLINFVKTDSFPVVYAEGSEDDSLAVAKGLIVRRTFYVPVLDSIFPEGYPIDSLRFIPHTQGVPFSLQAGNITTASKVLVQVFEAGALNFDILNGMDRQLIINLNDLAKDYKGIRVGNIQEANNNAGNWE
ncbi:MAG: hypothetical protein A2X22_06780 [Bacteroidetes bacterium GWF2_49_14]|nr:MAG: hypothetical protein A2X22_06780 [Bacteroidetes bacterium GWF2_49_14]HBB91035.1 hypothetical protein [Bacteroidales bacterium]